MAPDRLQKAFNAIDHENSQDPKQEVWEGVLRPAALVYGWRMSQWLDTVQANAPEALRIAARAQHIRRWDIPRDSYPQDRKGYLMWRKRLYVHHADVAEKILQGLGYAVEEIERVRFLIEKRQLNKDPDTQTLEDCACLVFLQFHFMEFAPSQDKAKLIGIVQKTWAKMSEDAQNRALSLDYPKEQLALLKEALSS